MEEGNITQKRNQLKGENTMSFFSKIEGFFSRILGSQATWERTASTTLNLIAPMAETIVGLTAGGPAEALAAGVVHDIQNDMAATSALLSTASGPDTKAKVLSLINGINANLQTLLADMNVKNSTHATEITAAVQGISGELSAIVQAIP
jgi:hypothetical protein